MNIIRNIFILIAIFAGMAFTAIGIVGETSIQQTAGGATGAALFLFVIAMLLEFHLQRIENLLSNQNELLERLARRARPKPRDE